jgi:CHAT domain-containing protein
MRGALAAAPALLLLGRIAAADGPVLKIESPLRDNQRVVSTLAGTEIKVYPLALRAGERATVTVERQDIEPVVELFDPNDQGLAEFPADGKSSGPFAASFTTSTSGTYQLRIHARYLSDAPRVIALRLESVAPASAAEVERFAALILSTESEAQAQAAHFDDAVALAEHALEAAQRGSSGEDEFLAELYYRLGVIQYNKAKQQPALAALENALRIDKAVIGDDGPGTARVLIALGRLYARFNDLPKSEDAMRRARTLIENAWGADHAWIADCMQMTAYIHQLRGDNARALADINEALAIARTHPAADPRRVILYTDTLADIYVTTEDYERAQPLLEENLRLAEQNLDRIMVAHSLQNLGIIARDRQQHAQALDYYWRAEKIREQAYGMAHPSTVSLLVNIGNVYHDQGDYARAEEVFQEALARFTNSVGPYHEWTVLTLFNLSKSYAAESNIPAALEALKRADDAFETSLSLNLAIGSEHDRLSYADKLHYLTGRTISLNITQAPNDVTATELAAQIILQRKGRVLDALADNLASLRRRLEPEGQALLDQLSAVTAEFAKVALHGEEYLSRDQFRAALDTLQRRQEALEIAISERSAGFYQEPRAVTLAAVRAALPEDAALLEYAIYHPVGMGLVTAADAPAHYAVYMIPASGAVQVRDLGSAKDLEALIDAFRRALRNPRTDPTPEAKRLYTQVLQPLFAASATAKRLIVSPDGALNLVPFEALMDEQGRYLVSQREISYVSSGRDLLRFAGKPGKTGPPAIVANPDFGEPAVAANATQRGIEARRSVTTAPDLASVYFASLSGTAREGRDLKALFPEAALLTGNSASKANLKRLTAPEILHIATHGFFVDREARAGASKGAADPRGIRATSAVENPLLRSGLALAGANLNKDGSGEGILTALEAANLNLWGTKLVTLSACDTGVGEIKNGEGVFGLRRAFVLAGAETLVMSLWPVSDSVTRQLMGDYYRGLKEGLGRGAALRGAQVAMTLRTNRTHPFYWASFIQAGNWASLESSSERSNRVR